MNVVRSHSSLLNKPAFNPREALLCQVNNLDVKYETEEICLAPAPQALDPIGDQIKSRFTWPDRGAPEYGDELVRMLRLDRDSLYAHLSDIEVDALAEYVYKCRERYWVDGAPMSTIKGVLYDVVLEDHSPLEQQPYKSPPDRQAILERHINKEVKLGTMKPRAGGRYLSPIIVVDVGKRGKVDGRMCCDYRKINRRTRKSLFPMPPLWEVLRKISKSKSVSYTHLTLPTNREV